MTTTSTDRPGSAARSADLPAEAAIPVRGPAGAPTAPLHGWLVARRNAGDTPDAIAATLIGAGWDADSAAQVSLRSLRSSDRQTVAYATLTVTAGVGALCSATAAHLILARNPDPVQLTWMLSIALVAVPLAICAALVTRSAERRSEFVMWSGSRRGWFGALACCTGLVGVVRLLSYLFLAIATLTGASERDLTGADVAQVGVSLVIAVPLFVWSALEWRRSNLVISALGDAEPR